MNDDLIRRSDALNVIKRNHHRLQGDGLTYTILIEQMKLVPKEKDILYLCDRKRCDNCHSECELTSDINHDAGARAVVIFDKAAMPKQGEWIPCSERLPEVHKEPYYADDGAILHESDHVLACCKVGSGYEYAIGTVIHDEVCNSYEWHGLYDYSDCEIDNMSALAWMPLPEPWKGADDE